MPEEKDNNTPKILYLDADTEITEAIEKLKKAKEKEVRIVVPSRSGLLQSSVNIKLLKKASKDSNKALILVTNDKITKNLAGSVGIAVASSVKALPHVPDVETAKDKIPEKLTIDEKENEEDSEEGFKSQKIDLSEDGEDISVEDEIPKKSKKDKKVPDYTKLNKRIWFSVAGVGAVIVLVLLYVFLPSAKVIVLTEAKKTSLNFNFILDASSTSSTIGSQVLASQKLETTKDVSFDISATGKKEIGNKATGTLSVRNCDDVSTHSLALGTTVTGGGKTFTVAQATTIPAGSAGGGVVNCSSAVDVQITATAPGDSFNVGPTTFSINGFSSLYKATGQTSGGTSKTVTVLSAEDIANAKKQAADASNSGKEDLSKKAGSDSMLFTATIQSDFTDFKTSVEQDKEADKVNVTAKIKFTGFSAKKNDVNQLFDQQIKSDLQGNKEIYQNGSEDGKYSVVKQLTPEKVQLNVKTSAYYGDPIDKKAIAKSVAGKPNKDVSDIVKKSGDQITGAQVENWPSLIPNMPLLASKITVEIRVTTQ
jgi:hypothetical protein